ncbi:amino acid ABC transporter permease [Lachnospiraceae bacterium ZAX-1]
MKSVTSFIGTFPKILSVIPSTMLLFFCVIITGTILGMLLTMVRLKKSKIGNAVVSIYISFIRGTPLLIQIMIVYFGLKAILVDGLGIKDASHLNTGVFVYVAYALNLACFLCETFRGAYLAIDKGQIEAAISISMNKSQVFRRVILPQGARIALPNMSNLLLDDLKAISLAFSIGFVEMMGKGQALSNARHGIGAIGIYLGVAITYWVLCFLLDKLLRGIENYLNKDIRVLGTVQRVAGKGGA